MDVSRSRIKRQRVPVDGQFSVSGTHPGHTIIPEYEVFIEGEGGPDKKLQECKKNPGHKNFIPVKDFSADCLPEHMRTKEILGDIDKSIARTVLVRVSYTSLERPDTFYKSEAPYPGCDIKGKAKLVRTGTGVIGSKAPRVEHGECPCRECRKSEDPRTRRQLYWMYHVNTSSHVVFDDSEAKMTTIKCFYDSEEKKDKIVTLYGFKLESVQSKDQFYWSDMCDRLTCVTHDEKAAEMLNSRIGECSPHFFDTDRSCGVMISHPHGCSKMISFGNLLFTTVPINTWPRAKRCKKFPKDAICYIESDTNEGEFICHHMCVGTFKKCLSKTKSLFKTTHEHYHTGSTFTLPDDAGYAMRYDYDRKGFTFPQGTKFNSMNGSAIPIPDNALFLSEELKEDIRRHQHHSIAYDISTCPGSSGASVCRYWDEDWQNFDVLYSTFSPHSGWDKAEQINYSGVNNPFIDMSCVDEHLKDT